MKRANVFETNSSSTHSIALAPSDGKLSLSRDYVVDEEGNFVIPSQEFGWEQEEYTDAASKACYAYLYIRDWVTGDDQDRFKALFEEVIKQQTAATGIVHEDGYPLWNSARYGSGKNSNDGYIDHQSVEDRDCDYLFASADKLKSFIFDYRTVLETDNDNH